MTEGWMAEKPVQIRRYHYVVDSMALCHEYGFYSGELQAVAEGFPLVRGRDDCATCFRRLKARRAKLTSLPDAAGPLEPDQGPETERS